MKDQMTHAEVIGVIADLREQVEKLKSERDDIDAASRVLVQELDNRHRANGVFVEANAGLREQLATLAEQNEKYRKVIPHCVVGASGYAVEQLFIECLSLPDLASPALNKYRVEGMEEALGLYSPDDTAQDWIDKIRARADELEKTNG